MDVDSRWLIQALVLAETSSFSTAAQRVGMTQSALSRSIRSLESAVGSPLFERTPGGVEPTAAGRVFLGRAREIRGQLDDLEREVRMIAGDAPSAVTLGLGPMTAFLLMGRVLPGFLASWPGVDVRVLVRSAPDLLTALRGGQIEMFVAEAAEARREARVEVTWLRERPVVAYGRPGHPLLADAPLAGVADLMAYPLVLMRALDEVMRWLREQSARGHTPASLVECESPPLSREIVLGSDAVGVGPRYLVEAGLASGELAEIALKVPPRAVRTGIVRLADRPRSRAAEALAERIREVDEATPDGAVAPGAGARPGRRRRAPPRP